MPQIIAPQEYNITSPRLVVFLAGSIEMGKASDWQDVVAKKILSAHPEIIIANPRRKSWDNSWKQSITNPHFSNQVNWELDYLTRADLAFFYFEPNTKSPVTLMELGYHLAQKNASEKTIICCPDGFWRKGNVEIMAQRAGIDIVFNSMDVTINKAINIISNMLNK